MTDTNVARKAHWDTFTNPIVKIVDKLFLNLAQYAHLAIGLVEESNESITNGHNLFRTVLGIATDGK